MESTTRSLQLGYTRECFLVSGEDLGHQNSEFIEFLRSEGFQCKYGFWDCPWVWVNIDSKVYGRGRPGVAYAGVIGGHAITIMEFMTIAVPFSLESLTVMDTPMDWQERIFLYLLVSWL